MCESVCFFTCIPQMGSSNRYTPGDCPSWMLPVATSDSKSFRFSSLPHTYTRTYIVHTRTHTFLQYMCVCPFELNTHLHRRDSNRETSSSFLPALIDEFEQPGDGAGNHTQSLERVVTANHGVGFTCEWGVEHRRKHSR